MKKLEVGDYVKNLTEKQFDKIMKLQPNGFSKYEYNVDQTDTLYLHEYHSGLAIEFQSHFFKTLNQPLKQELTYLQFIRRAKNTF